MPESTLTADLFDLEAEAGDRAGFGMGERFDDTAWTKEQLRDIKRAVQSGVSSVYWTQEMEGVPARYDWSWLRPRTRITLPANVSSVNLPDDFNGMLAEVIPASGSGEVQFPIPVVGLSQYFRATSVGSTTTGRPMMAYVEAIKGTGTEKSNRYRLLVWPISDAAYTLQVWYEVAPDALTAALPFVYGGPALADTFRAAVRAAYGEIFEPDTDTTVRSVQTFQNKLRAAIAGDRKFKPLTIGQNADMSDDGGQYLIGQHGVWGVPFELNGLVYR